MKAKQSWKGSQRRGLQWRSEGSSYSVGFSFQLNLVAMKIGICFGLVLFEVKIAR